jgi:hypothetical protein
MLNRRDLTLIAKEANVFQLLGKTKQRKITLDYVGARPAMIIPRLEGDGPLETCAPHVEEITYELEDQMFAGDLYVTLNSRGHVVVSPFRWEGWDKLATSFIIC